MPNPDRIEIKQLDVELNGGCNYKCNMCPQAHGREKDFLKKLPLSTLEKILDDAVAYGLESVSIHGSGEPTLNHDMPDAVALVKERGLNCISFTNGYKLTELMSQRLIEAGIDILRVSAIGYNKESYQKWMSVDGFEMVRSNVKQFIQLNEKLGGESEIHLHHLITNSENLRFEIDAYRSNWVNHTGALAEIWMMHNWSGGYEGPYERKNMVAKGSQIRSCGRPFADLLQVRAGGEGDRVAAVVACCMVLGKDSSAILGHLDTSSISEVVASKPYEELRAAHRESRFEDISYCKDCDQLFDYPPALVWTNIPNRSYGQSKIHESIDHRSAINELKDTISKFT